MRFHGNHVRTLLATRQGVLSVSILFRATQWWACDAPTLHSQRRWLAGTDGAPAEAKGRDVRVPFGAGQVELLVSLEEATVRRVGLARRESRVQTTRLVLTRWAAFPWECHCIGALHGRAHDGVTYQTASLTGAHDASLVSRRPLGPVVEHLAVVVALVVGLDSVDLVVLTTTSGVARIAGHDRVSGPADDSALGELGEAVVGNSNISDVSSELDLLGLSRLRCDQ